MNRSSGQVSKKNDILKAGLELFAAKGYKAVSVRDIAKTAGVSEAALYKHFKGKEDMALYIFSEIIKKYSQKLLPIQRAEISAVEKLCRIVEITYDWYQVYSAEIKFALLSQYDYWETAELERKPHNIIKAILKEGIKKGEIPNKGVFFLITMYTGIMLQPLAQYPYFYDVLPEFPRLKEQVIEMVRKMFQK